MGQQFKDLIYAVLVPILPGRCFKSEASWATQRLLLGSPITFDQGDKRIRTGVRLNSNLDVSPFNLPAPLGNHGGNQFEDTETSNARALANVMPSPVLISDDDTLFPELPSMGPGSTANDFTYTTPLQENIPNNDAFFHELFGSGTPSPAAKSSNRPASTTLSEAKEPLLKRRCSRPCKTYKQISLPTPFPMRKRGRGRPAKATKHLIEALFTTGDPFTEQVFTPADPTGRRWAAN